MSLMYMVGTPTNWVSPFLVMLSGPGPVEPFVDEEPGSGEGSLVDLEHAVDVIQRQGN
jgi:hypothetical protein